MKTNSFKCPYCNKYTRHITISMREQFASDGAPQVIQFLFGSINDYLGTAKLGELLTGNNHWKCTECGLSYAPLMVLLNGKVPIVNNFLFLYVSVNRKQHRN